MKLENPLVAGGRALPRGNILQVSNALGQRLYCRDGSLWITQDGDPRDIILDAGESFDFDRPGVALVYALAPSAVSLCTPL